MAGVDLFWPADDGVVPNNPSLPLVVYRGALACGPGAEHAICQQFEANGWSNGWVNGIYSFHHYHATAHEVLGLASGRAHVQFGGPAGPIVEVGAGDGVLIPAGVGHCRISASADLVVVGAYPGGCEWDLVRATPEAYAASLALIAAVPPPARDPVTGVRQPVWHRQ
ncbi:MAG: cupin [Hyphomicrobiaceae bacterium]